MKITIDPSLESLEKALVIQQDHANAYAYLPNVYLVDYVQVMCWVSSRNREVESTVAFPPSVYSTQGVNRESTLFYWPCDEGGQVNMIYVVDIVNVINVYF